jgi:di/tricarboxylate transporter
MAKSKINFTDLKDSKNFLLSLAASAFVALIMTSSELTWHYFGKEITLTVISVLCLFFLWWSLKKFLELKEVENEIESAKLKQKKRKKLKSEKK